MNNSIYCSRKGGATIKGKFHPFPRCSDFLSRQIARYSDKMAIRRAKREAKAEDNANF